MSTALLHPEAIVFDWDDVFTFGSFEAYCACYQQAARYVGMVIEANEAAVRIKSQWGRPHRDEITALLGGHPELIEEASKEYERCIFTDVFTDHLRFIDGGRDLLTRLRPQYRLAIATGIHPHLLKERVMPRFAVSPSWFEQIVTSYDLTDPARGKPYPDMLEMALHKMNVAPEDAIVIGDAIGDVRMAQAAGVIPIAVLTGQLSRQEAEALGISYILNAVTDLPTILTA